MYSCWIKSNLDDISKSAMIPDSYRYKQSLCRSLPTKNSFHSELLTKFSPGVESKQVPNRRQVAKDSPYKLQWGWNKAVDAWKSHIPIYISWNVCRLDIIRYWSSNHEMYEILMTIEFDRCHCSTAIETSVSYLGYLTIWTFKHTTPKLCCGILWMICYY